MTKQHPIDVLADVNAALAVIECVLDGLDRKIASRPQYEQNYEDTIAVFIEIERQVTVLRPLVAGALHDHDREVRNAAS